MLATYKTSLHIQLLNILIPNSGLQGATQLAEVFLALAQLGLLELAELSDAELAD